MVDLAKKDPIPLFEPTFSGNEWKYVKDCLDSGWVSSAGSYVKKFEDEFTKRLGGESNAVAVVNGTAALHIALLLAGIGPEEEVIVPTITFVAPINAVHYVGANPVFMDCDEFLNMDPEKTRFFFEEECFFDGTELFNLKTKRKIKAIVVVHVFGCPVNIVPFLELATKYRLKIIEDAAESIGSLYKKGACEGRQTGTVGDFGCFSFNGNKIITAGGGGMILAKSKETAEKARYYTTQAKNDPEKFIHDEVGYNYRLNNIQAAMGCAQLEQLDEYLSIKRANFALYQKELEDIDGIDLLGEPHYGQTNHWLYTIRIDEKRYGRSVNDLKFELLKAGVETRFVWQPNHLQKPYQRYQAYRIERALDIQKFYLNIPSSVTLKLETIRHVCEKLAALAKK